MRFIIVFDLTLKMFLRKNKQEMSDTNITLPQSAISLASFLPVCMCYMLVSRFGPIWTREGLLTEETPTLKLDKDSQKVKSRD